jgi:hypothetical protein
VFIPVLVINAHDTALCLYTTLMTLCIKYNHSKWNTEPYHVRYFLCSFYKVFTKIYLKICLVPYSIARYCCQHYIKDIFCVSDRFITRKLLLFTAVIVLHETSFSFSTTIQLGYFWLLPESSYHHGSLILSGIIIAGNFESPWLVMFLRIATGCV